MRVERGVGTDWKGPGYFAKTKGNYEGCHDQMHFTDVLSGHCVEGNKETSKGVAWAGVAGDALV